jgi:hypothetical protein
MHPSRQTKVVITGQKTRGVRKAGRINLLLHVEQLGVASDTGDEAVRFEGSWKSLHVINTFSLD